LTAEFATKAAMAIIPEAGGAALKTLERPAAKIF
jgi:hypothetical protein